METGSKAVLVTGSSTGIGEAIARLLSEKGFRVFAGVRTAQDGARLEGASTLIKAVTLDVTRPESIKAARDFIQSHLNMSMLWSLVNNAGIVVAGPNEFIPLKHWKMQFDINFFGAVSVTQAFLPLLRETKGARIVNMGSVSGRLSTPILGPYCASKFALRAFNDSLRQEVREFDIHVSLIEPGAVRTPIWQKSKKTAETVFDDQTIAELRPLYGNAVERAQRMAVSLERAGARPEDVAFQVLNAMHARWPRPYYRVGFGVWPQIILSRLPVWFRDRVLNASMAQLARAAGSPK